MEKKYTFCRICEALCGLEVSVEDNKIIDIKPDPQHVATKGFACPKGLKQHKMYDSPDRLKYPMKRVGKEWQRTSWEQAMSEIGEKVRTIRSEFSPDSIAMYVGTAAGFGVLHPVFAKGFMDGIGSKSMFSSATQDCSNKFAVSRQMYGFPFTLTFPDLDNTNCLIVVGANPVISKWSFLQVPKPSKHLKDIEKRGGKVFFIDPRKTESAKVAGTHIAIRPNTDIFFYLSFLNELLKLKAYDLGRVEQYMEGFENLKALAQVWTAERCEEVTQIPTETLKSLVKTYAESEGAALYCSTGVNMGTNGSLAFWIQEAINAISGNLDKKGGTLVSKGVIDFPKFGVKKGVLMSEDKSRVGKFTKVNDAFPGGILADEILKEGNRQIKALFVTGGNPLITMANSNRLRKAFEKLELLVCLDIQPSETATVGNYMLPCTSPLQRPDLPFIFPLMLGLQAKPYLQATKSMIEPEYEQRDEASIYLDLAKASGVNIFGSYIAQKFFELTKRWKRKKSKTEQSGIPQEGFLSALLRLTRQKSFKKLLKYPHGLLRKGHDIEDFLGKRVLTPSGKVNLAPQPFLKQAKKLEDDFRAEIQNKNKFKLITKRAVTTHNSWTHNIEEFTQADRRTNYLYLHPHDAKKIGVKQGDLVDVTSETATVRLPAKILKDLMLGTVALPHGWGHQHSKLNVANKTSGVNVNILAADGPNKLEKLSGMAHLTGIVVEVKPAQGTLASDSWSGLAKDRY